MVSLPSGSALSLSLGPNSTSITLPGLLWALWTLVKRVPYTFFNGRNPIRWAVTVIAGAWPAVLWTWSFKQAKHIPTEWRPTIHTDLLYILNPILLSPLGLLTLSLSLIPLSQLLYFFHTSSTWTDYYSFHKWGSSVTGGGNNNNNRREGNGDEEDEEEGEKRRKEWDLESGGADLGAGPSSSSSTPYHMNGNAHPSTTSTSTSTSSLDIIPSSEWSIADAATVDPHSTKTTTKEQESSSSSLVLSSWRERRKRNGKWLALIILGYPWFLAAADWAAFRGVTPTLDLMAFVTYGALHFASPFIGGFWLWGFAPQGVAHAFGHCLGFQNLLGLMTHLIFPTAAPWFFDVYGEPGQHPVADYEHFGGNPAGLVRVDEILGTHIYKAAFKMSPVVFGAIPSLHAATGLCFTLFVSRYCTWKGKMVMFIYCFWMFWSTMYLHHHFAIDLVAGSWLAVGGFLITYLRVLRRVDRRHKEKGLTTAWERLWYGRRDGENYAPIIQGGHHHHHRGSPSMDAGLGGPAWLSDPDYIPMTRSEGMGGVGGGVRRESSYRDSSSRMAYGDDYSNRGGLGEEHHEDEKVGKEQGSSSLPSRGPKIVIFDTDELPKTASSSSSTLTAGPTIPTTDEKGKRTATSNNRTSSGTSTPSSSSSTSRGGKIQILDDFEGDLSNSGR